MKELSTTEINMVLEKIRSRYSELIGKYKRSPSLKEGFEERYIHALKLRRNLTMFLLAEIEAVEEIYKNEQQKCEDAIKKKNSKPAPSFADKVLEANRKRYSKYTRLSFIEDVDDETAFLCGAARDFLNTQMPVMAALISMMSHTVLTNKFNAIYNDMIEQIGYKADVPAAKHYTGAIQSHRDQAKIVFEYQKLIQNMGFLLNSCADIIKRIAEYYYGTADGKKNAAGLIERRLSAAKSADPFKNKNVYDAITMIQLQLNAIITDFRLKEIRKL